MDLVEQRIARALGSDNPLMGPMLQHVLGGRGKRLRPALVLLSGMAVGATNDVHLDVATAIELIHMATLVHDDIIDEATLRRQTTSLNAKFGNETAVILGDYVLARAVMILAQLENPVVLQEIARTTNAICEGELLQAQKRFDFDLSRREYETIIDQKTASLFGSSCNLGVLLAGGSSRQQVVLREFGRELGIAFQIVDDCVDIVGDEDRAGKSLGTDLKKGKWTLPMILLREQLNETDWADIQLLLVEDLKETAMKRLIRDLFEHGAVDQAMDEARLHIARAQAQLNGIPAGPALLEFRRLVGDVVDRYTKTVSLCS